MSKHNEYFISLNDLTKDLDTTIQKEMIDSYLQSINDLNLEDSTYLHIVKILGTPKEFYNEFIIEMSKTQVGFVNNLEHSDA